MSIARHHAEWLSLVPVSGPFLSLPVLLDAFPQGLDAHEAEHARLLRLAHEEWEDSFHKGKVDPALHNAWIKFVLTRTLEFDKSLLAEGQAIPQTLQVDFPEHSELLRPSIVVNDPATKKARLLVQVYPPTQDLSSYVAGSRWKASPDTRMTDLLHGTGVRLGLVTNGEHWMLVDAPKGETTGYASWYASLWREEKITLQAFRSLLSLSRFFGVADDQTIEALLTKSASNQQEVTDQLGRQVLRAVEVLIQSLDKADQDHGRELLQGVGETVLYESALNIMMRLVFLFCAEERELIPTKPFPVYEKNYSVSGIFEQLRQVSSDYGEELLERRYDAWPRLLTAFRAVYGGISHDEVYMPAYGGRLFDPDRFPFLEGRKPKTSWQNTEATPLPVNNRTVLHLLEALQLLQVKVPGGGPSEARRLSFRALDIEQIGHVYEGLLDHTAKRGTEPTLGLFGKKEPEVTLQTLEQQRSKGDKSFFEFLKKETGGSRKWEKYLDVELDDRQQVRLRTACGNDESLYQRVLPFAGLIRDDTFGYPVVIPTGSVFVTAGTDRRSSGTHYTPRTLTEPIVQYTLEPLVYAGPAEGKPKGEWKLKSAAELLDLKICDMACGSGAFLVQAARYMSERLMEAWDAAKEQYPDVPGITPEGKPSSGKAGESLIPSDPAERTTYALRIVAQRCLYGVDINPLATEMAKLSLWLLTLAKDKPFEFLDHAIRCGDSLVGLHSLEQLKHFCLKPNDHNQPMFSGPWLDGVDEAIDLRLKLEDMPSNTVEDIEAQEALLKVAEDKIARLRCAADLLVAAVFWGEGTKDKQEKVRHAAVVAGHYVENGPTEEFEEHGKKERRGQRMFHWPLEFPEVIVKRGGFDAFVGNPPFLGRRNLANSLGEFYRAGLTSLWPDVASGADLCVFFFNRAYFDLMHGQATFGLLACNTIAQGATRKSGLEAITVHGGSIFRANSSVRWPGTANVYVSLVHVSSGAYAGQRILDDVESSEISSALDASLHDASHPLADNDQKSFQGFIPLGSGFNISRSVAESLISQNERNSEVVFPCMNGRQLYSSPKIEAEDWIIFFGDLDERSARSYGDIYNLLRHQLYEERQNQKQKQAKTYWWRFWRTRPDLRHAIKDIPRMIATAFTSSTLAFAFVPSHVICTNALVVFAFDSWAAFGVLQSSLHQQWALQLGSTMKQDLRYTPTVCFQTFPMPLELHLAESPAEICYRFRGECMVRRGEGLTQIYNRLHDPDMSSSDIQTLRALHVEMDKAVTAAYGWDDLDLGHGFHETKQGLRFTINETARREVLQRLLKLNHERYAEEVKQGLHDKTKRSKGKNAKPAKHKKVAAKPISPTLFNLEDDATFPSTRHELFLCGLACDLIAAEPGMPPNAYRDALVIAVGFQRHKRLLTGAVRTKFVKLCKAIPAASRSAARRVPWDDVKRVLTLNNAIVVHSKEVRCGAKLAQFRKTYPAVDSELVTLIRKAAAELRDLQSQALPTVPQATEILNDFEEDRRTMCGAST